jgi:alpha-tubulin suppressor-like RCC1 family protein
MTVRSRFAFLAAVVSGLSFACGSTGLIEPVGDGGSADGRTDAAGPPRPYLGVFTGSFHTCVVDGRELGCAGWNYWGQLGDGTRLQTPDAAFRTSFAFRPIAGAFRAGTANFTHSCFVVDPGDVYCMGDDGVGAVGSNRGPALTPQKVAGISGVKAIDSGRGYTCAIDEKDTVKCWGLNASGELGDGTTAPFDPSPHPVAGLGAVRGIASGDSHTCATLEDRSVSCWGISTEGLTTIDSSLLSRIPEKLEGASKVDALAAGATFTCIVSGGGVSCIGNNRFGTLGSGPEPALSRTFVVVPGLRDVSLITAGNGHVCAVHGGDKSVSCWGINNLGQLGNKTRDTVYGPVALSAPEGAAPLANVVAISAQNYHTCARTADSKVYCWGDNSFAELGTGKATPDVSTVPVQIR